jgi:hypothetical protein
MEEVQFFVKKYEEYTREFRRNPKDNFGYAILAQSLIRTCEELMEAKQFFKFIEMTDARGVN